MHPNLKNVVELLQQSDIPALRARWLKVFGSLAPAQAKRDLLTRCLAYALQERDHGALSKSALKELRTDGSQGTARSNATVHLGARLVRGWGGTAHEVTVVERGFAYRGKTYRSLSEIARTITGARWSGPRFFGVRAEDKPAGAAHDRHA